MNDWVGKTLGNVHIDLLLARGGMAEVYLGTHITLQRSVAVKILRNQFEDDPVMLERFQREARVIAKLRHQNIVQVLDFNTTDNQPYLVMEYIEGPSLSKYLHSLHERSRRLEIPPASRLLSAVAGALQYAHESGVIHRDVKPGNILLTSRAHQITAGQPLPADFIPVLTDFGLVRFLNSIRHSYSGIITGTPAYMSPEQARGEETDERTDIYSLGIVLYEILAGRVPFEGETTMSVILKHITDPPPPIFGLSPLLQNLLDRSLAKNTADRFQTANEFLDAFNKAVEERSEAATITQEKIKPAIGAVWTKPRVKSRIKWISAFLAGVIVLSGIILLRGLPLLGNGIPTQTPQPTMSANSVAVPLGPTGVLHFQDGSAIMDEVILTALAMPAPPASSQYEVWLVSPKGEERRSIGKLSLDKNGMGTLIYEDNQSRNLLALFGKVEVTVESNPDLDPDPSDQVAYSFALPGVGLAYIRQLLVAFPEAPQEIALIQGLNTDIKLVAQHARAMLNAYEKGDEASIQREAESILNMLAGSQSENYSDWNGDGQIADSGGGYGLLLNGDNLGYIQAVYSHADYALNSPDATQNMITHGNNVKTCAQNLAQWTPQLQNLIFAILTPTSGSDMDKPIHDADGIANQMLNGIDRDNNGRVEPILGECGILIVYEQAYHMADMPLLPVGPIGIPNAGAGTSTPSPTTTATSIINVPTKPLGGGDEGGAGVANTPAPPANTQKPPHTPPGQIKTKKP